jgi:hypothetical protein
MKTTSRYSAIDVSFHVARPAHRVLCFATAAFITPSYVAPSEIPMMKTQVPVMIISRDEGANLLQNADFATPDGEQLASWSAFEGGYSVAPGQGREGRHAIVLERKDGDTARGISQNITLDQKIATPLTFSGWSKTENVSGTSSSDFSLYADFTYQDNSKLYGQVGTFAVGTHDWQRVRFTVLPSQAIKSVTFYSLLRGKHTGKAWISDLKVVQLGGADGAVFDGVPVTLPTQSTLSGAQAKYSARDGLSLEISPRDWRVSSLKIGARELSARNAPSGFMARDVASESDYFGFENGTSTSLGLQLDAKVVNAADHIAIEGTLRDTTQKDRAVSLVFALPVDATGWNWGAHIRSARQIASGGEFSTNVAFEAGSNGSHAQYPYSNIYDRQHGLSLAADVEHGAQYRLAYNAGTRSYFIAYDFGLVPEQPAGAKFRFIIYRTDASWGFRDATQRYHTIYQSHFAVRDAAKKQGLWMPFTNIENLPNPADFGFRFREASVDGRDSLAVGYDDKNGYLTLRYTEPMTWWMVMAPETPRTYEAAVAQLNSIAADPTHANYKRAQTVLSSAFREADGRMSVTFKNEPWANGAVWSLNPDPGVPGEITEAKTKWGREVFDQVYNRHPHGTVDGEYLDSLEGYVTATLNFNRAHFASAGAPLTFSINDRRPATHKSLLTWVMVRAISSDLHARNKLLMANGTPYRLGGLLMPWVDTAGTEANWIQDGKYAPDSDELMNLRRTLSAAKPYHLLQNTRFEQFDTPLVERYMQRCLFYGIYPSFFSFDASTDAYFTNPKYYNRERHLFLKYVPLVKQIGEAGWQPITLARADNTQVWLERFGAANGTGAQYLTLQNGSAETQKTRITLPPSLVTSRELVDSISGARISRNGNIVAVEMAPEQTMMLQLR